MPPRVRCDLSNKPIATFGQLVKSLTSLRMLYTETKTDIFRAEETAGEIKVSERPGERSKTEDNKQFKVTDSYAGQATNKGVKGTKKPFAQKKRSPSNERSHSVERAPSREPSPAGSERRGRSPVLKEHASKTLQKREKSNAKSREEYDRGIGGRQIHTKSSADR